MLGKNPDSSDKFIVVDNIGSNSSRQSFKILVGTGSSKQDFVGALSTRSIGRVKYHQVTSVTLNNSPIEDYTHSDDDIPPTR